MLTMNVTLSKKFFKMKKFTAAHLEEVLQIAEEALIESKNRRLFISGLMWGLILGVFVNVMVNIFWIDILPQFGEGTQRLMKSVCVIIFMLLVYGFYKSFIHEFKFKETMTHNVKMLKNIKKFETEKN